MNELIALMVILPIASALFLNLFHHKDRTIKILAIVTALVLPIIPLVAHYGPHFFGGYVPLSQNATIGSDLPAIITGTQLFHFHPGIMYLFNSANQLMIFILCLISFFAVFLSLNETKRPSGVYTFLMFMGTASVSAILLSNDIFNVFVFFEIAALTQVGLIIVSGIKNNYEVALKYILLGNIAGPILLLGIALLLGITGNVNISDIVFSIKNGLVDQHSPVILMALALITFGWLYASGLPPFHNVKSAVYSKALPHGAALLQAFSVFTMVAIGIIILEIFSYLPITKTAILGISLLAMVLGITMAIVQTNFKRMLGFLAVGELGYIGIGLGLGTTLGITAGLFQAINEAVITAFLFIGFGTVLYKTRTSNTKKLGGMMFVNPRVALMVLLAGLAMAGIPPLNAFQSKLMLIQASIQSGLPELGIIMILLSIVTFMTFMKAFYTIYMRPKPAELEVLDNKIPKSTILAMVVFLIVCIVLGLFPQIAINSLQPLVAGLV